MFHQLSELSKWIIFSILFLHWTCIKMILLIYHNPVLLCICNGPTKNDLLTKFLAASFNATRPVVDGSHPPDINQTTTWLHLHGDWYHPHRGINCSIQRSIFSSQTKYLPEGSPQFGEGEDVDDWLEGAVEQGEGEGDVEEEGGLGGDHLEGDVDIYIMMQCLSVCNEKWALPPGSLL